MTVRWRLIIPLFFAGFFLGTLGDYCHVISRTDAYPAHVYRYYLAGVPFWVPFVFGVAALAIGLSHLEADRWLGPSWTRPGAGSALVVAYGLAVFVGLYALSGFLRFSPIINHLILALGALSIWLGLDRTWQGLLLAFATAIVGSVAEIAMVRLGVFFYYPRAAHLLGVPDWLPWLYVGASVAVGNFARYLSRDREVSILH